MKTCPQCDKQFKHNASRPHHLFCSLGCKESYARSKSWRQYFRSLINKNKKRKRLTPEILETLLNKQGGRCALTGLELTKILGKGRVWTNASIDRIKPGGRYSVANIRLVCNFINSWRGNVTDDELVFWCKKVVEHNDRA